MRNYQAGNVAGSLLNIGNNELTDLTSGRPFRQLHLVLLSTNKATLSNQYTPGLRKEGEPPAIVPAPIICLLRRHRALGAHGYPLIPGLHEHIHPYPFAAGVFAFHAALFGVAPLHDGNISQHLDVHRAKLERLQLLMAGFDVGQSLLFRSRRAIRAQTHPVVGKQHTEFVRVAQLSRRPPNRVPPASPRPQPLYTRTSYLPRKPRQDMLTRAETHKRSLSFRIPFSYQQWWFLIPQRL